jgi:hypothetical protein
MVSQGLLIDARGEAWPDDAPPPGLAGAPTDDLPSYAVREAGCIHLRVQDGGMRVALRPGGFGQLAFAGALLALERRGATRVVLALATPEGWSHEIFADLWSFAERAEDMAAEGPIASRNPWHATELGLEALSAPAYAKVRPLLELWRARRGRVDGDLVRTLAGLGLLHRSIVVRQPPRSKRLVVEHFGAGIRMLKPCESFLIIGREFDDWPDRDYAERMAEGYVATLTSRRPRLEAIRAILGNSAARTVRVRYDRLLMPWTAATGDRLVLCVSMLRELSTVA